MKRQIVYSCLKCCLAIFVVNICCLVTADFASAQNNGGKVSGIIYDASGPLTGATVVVKNTQNGAISGLDGDYTLSGLKKGDVLVVSFVGYETMESPWNGTSRQDFTIKVSSELLEEVVVTALGIKREEKALSYNVQQVNAEKLNAVKDVNFINSMVGKVAGVQINSDPVGRVALPV